MPEGLKKTERILQHSEETSVLASWSLEARYWSKSGSMDSNISFTECTRKWLFQSRKGEGSFTLLPCKKKTRRFLPVTLFFILNVESTKILWSSLCKKQDDICSLEVFVGFMLWSAVAFPPAGTEYAMPGLPEHAGEGQTDICYCPGWLPCPSLKLTYIALLAFERMLQETSTCRNAGQTCCK